MDMPTQYAYDLIQEWNELRRLILGLSDPVEHLRVFRRMGDIQRELESVGIIRYVSDPELHDGSFYVDQRI
jgi:hypothetical protein